MGRASGHTQPAMGQINTIRRMFLKRFINNKLNIVTESIDGFLATTRNANIARLDGYPHTKVLVRTDWDKSSVALISGGGSGHEPAHAGFIGEGMLTAAICGEVFASPSVDAVLAGILAVTGDAGCLLIVKNYTGDRLNFGLAAERAKAMGLRVEMVIVADDVSIPDAPQPRGVAGTLFVHKIAGHLAANGANLAEVTAEAKRTACSCASIGLSLDTCTVPGNDKAENLGEDLAELGLGIHGEPGVSKIPMTDADSLMAQVCSALEGHVQARQKYAALINNLGAVPPLEMAILAHAFRKMPLAAQVDITIGPAHLMTSLDMNGFSISLMPLDEARRTALAAHVGAPDWPGIRENGTVNIVAMPPASSEPIFTPSTNAQTRDAITAVCNMLLEAEDDLNTLDARIGDGDTGTTFGNAARSILAEGDSLPYANSADLCAAISAMLTRHMGGSSGVLLSIMFVTAGKSNDAGASWADAMMEGVKQMQVYGGASLGDRTMLDALIPALQSRTLEDAAISARIGADTTAQMEKASAGRAAYISADDLAGVIDPGAEAIARIFAILAK